MTPLRYEVHEARGHLRPHRRPHLLLVHGFLTGPSQWLANLEALATVCTPVTVSLWGHAGAPSPGSPADYAPDAYVGAFEALREHLGVDRWFTLGYSLGAALTLRYALAHPDRIIAHAFTNSTSALADVEQQRAWQAGAAASAERIRRGGRAAMERIPVHPRHARRLPAPLFDALAGDAARHDPAGIAGTLQYTNPHASVRGRLAENVPPALLLCGTRERRFRPHREHLAEVMTNLRIADLDAGHGMNMEAPTDFNTALVEFLRECRTS